MRVIAIERFEYANKLRNAGDLFETDSDKDAELLLLAKRVQRAEEKQKAKTQNIDPEFLDMRMLNADGTQAKIDPKKQRYMRRDMRAKE